MKGHDAACLGHPLSSVQFEQHTGRSGASVPIQVLARAQPDGFPTRIVDPSRCMSNRAVTMDEVLDLVAYENYAPPLAKMMEKAQLLAALRR